MSENDNGEDSRFKPGQSGNPAGKPKGAVNGRSRALAALDRITGKEENVRILADALEEQLRKKPVWFFVNIIMPLLPRESRGVLEAGDRVVEWKSLVSTAGAAAVARGGDESAE